VEDYPNHGPKDEDLIVGGGVTSDEMQAVARHQLVGSIAVAALVVAIAGLTAVRPVQKEAAFMPSHAIAVVRQPILATPPGHNIVAVKNAATTP
jgi:hypothetical protein